MQQIKILIADDAASVRMAIKAGLKTLGYNDIAEVADGAAAVEQYNAIQPDLAILDIAMPHLDGIGALKAIKAIDPFARIIICSAMGQESVVVEAIRQGALDFIVKPVTPDQISKSVKAIFKD